MQSRLNVYTDRQWKAVAADNAFSVSRVAKQCEVTVRQLERFIQEKFKQSPHAWMRSVRLGLAVELLLEAATVKEVANELGYRRVSHFCSDFKTRFHCSPGQYKRHNTIPARTPF